MSPATRTTNSEAVGSSPIWAPTAIATTPAKIAGITSVAWLYRTPYQGTRPVNSRRSVEPINATKAATVGPPSRADARIGAAETLTVAPRGVRTGKADAMTVTMIQKTVDATGAA